MAIPSNLNFLFGSVGKGKRIISTEMAEWWLVSFNRNNITMVTTWLSGFETETTTVALIETFEFSNWLYVLAKVVEK